MKVASVDSYLHHDLPRIPRPESPDHHPRVPPLSAMGLTGSQREAALLIGPPLRTPAVWAKHDAPSHNRDTPGSV